MRTLIHLKCDAETADSLAGWAIRRDYPFTLADGDDGAILMDLIVANPARAKRIVVWLDDYICGLGQTL